MQTYTIDAENKKVGRIASEAAKLLMGKNRTDFVRNAIPDVSVTITNASKADISDRKMKEELKASWSSFPGGIKTPTVGQVIQKRGHAELFRRAVNGMLPKNKLRAQMIKRLKVTE